MKNPIKVSVITVCLNAAATIKQTIDSIRSQTYFLNMEHIIVDGASKDRTVEIIKKYNNPKINYISEPDNGIYDAMNKGIKLVTGDVIYFLNADDTFYSRKVVETIAKEFESNKADIIYGNVKMISNKNDINYIQKYNNVDKIYLTTKNICHQAMFCRAKLYNKYGGFNPNYKIANDYDWYLKMIFKNNVASHYADINISIFSLDGISGDSKYRNATIAEFNTVARRYFSYGDRLTGRIRFLPEYIKWLIYQNVVKPIQRVVKK